jgi:hypothetical protein
MVGNRTLIYQHMGNHNLYTRMNLHYHSFAKDPNFPSWLDRESEKDYKPEDHGEPPNGADWV